MTLQGDRCNPLTRARPSLVPPQREFLVTRLVGTTTKTIIVIIIGIMITIVQIHTIVKDLVGITTADSWTGIPEKTVSLPLEDTSQLARTCL